MTTTKKTHKRTVPARRRDGGGHLHPRYAADMRERARHNRRDEDLEEVNADAHDDALGSMMGEQFLKTATSGEDQEMGGLDRNFPWKSVEVVPF